jgi:hypothetical protein
MSLLEATVYPRSHADLSKQPVSQLALPLDLPLQSLPTLHLLPKAQPPKMPWARTFLEKIFRIMTRARP